MIDVFGQNILESFNFNGVFEGTVVDNSKFKDSNTISVFIPELTLNSNGNRKIDAVDFIQRSKIKNYNELNLPSETIQNTNYIDCKPIVLNAFFTKVDYEKLHKPKLDSRVIVVFINGNPKNAYYINAFLSRKEDKIGG